MAGELLHPAGDRPANMNVEICEGCRLLVGGVMRRPGDVVRLGSHIAARLIAKGTVRKVR